MIDRELSNVPNTSLEGDGKQDYSFSCIFDEDMLKDLPDESSNVVKEDDKFGLYSIASPLGVNVDYCTR